MHHPMAGDWDLSAVVRSCGNVTAASDTSTSFFSSDDTENPLSCLATLVFEEDNEGSFGSRSPATCVGPLATGPFDELESLCPSFFRSVPGTSRVSSPPVASVPQLTVPIPAWDNPVVLVSQPLLYRRHRPQHQEAEPLILSAVRPPALNSKSKKRKTQPKSVCHFTGDTLSSDPWAWRKYGQKPIKGSPYPRSYYRCSSSKACMARKQVERSGDDPEILVVMYTGEHSHPLPTHRNSLAGISRNKFSSLSNSPQKESSPTLASDNTDLSPVAPLPSPGFEDTTNSENNDDTIASMMDEDDDMARYHRLVPNVGMSKETFVEYRQVDDSPGPNLNGLASSSADVALSRNVQIPSLISPFSRHNNIH